MCFSAGASFAGGVIISAIGVLTVTQIHKKSQLVFGSIPLFFGIQQVAEGLLWMSLPNPELIVLQNFSKSLFLIMALVLWPSMIPLSVLLMENNRKRKTALWILLGVGIMVSLYYSFCLISFSVTPEIMEYHIRYNNEFPRSLAMVAFLAYLTATIPPLFLSSIRRTRLLGILMFLSCAVTAIFFTQYLTSVWCFFAALISGVIFWILSDSKRTFRLEKLSRLKKEIVDPVLSKLGRH